MTETEWLTAAEPRGMIDFVGGPGKKRKLRLFICACCRQVLNPFAPPLVERAVAVAEAFAAGEVSAATLAQVRDVVSEAVTAASLEDDQNGTGYSSHLLRVCWWACNPVVGESSAKDATDDAVDAAHDVPRTGDVRTRTLVELRSAVPSEERVIQATLVRDIFGNPFQSVGIELEWLTETVIALARGIYAERAFDRMPILADALQDAGCDDEGILAHCRQEGEHVRGCWVVDLLLGRS